MPLRQSSRLLAITLLVVTGTAASVRAGDTEGPQAQRYYPPPMRPQPLQYPPRREIGLHVSGNVNLVSADQYGMCGVSYTRSLSDMFAVEATVDATHRFDTLVGFSSVRALVRRYHPEFGEWFMSIGGAIGFPGGDAARYPHGAGLVVGGGIQPRFSSHAALRLETQLLRFSHDMIGVRMTAGFLVGFD